MGQSFFIFIRKGWREQKKMKAKYKMDWLSCKNERKSLQFTKAEQHSWGQTIMEITLSWVTISWRQLDSTYQDNGQTTNNVSKKLNINYIVKYKSNLSQATWNSYSLLYISRCLAWAAIILKIDQECTYCAELFTVAKYKSCWIYMPGQTSMPNHS